MLSILHLELPAEEVRAQPAPPPPEVVAEESPAAPEEASEEFEIVLGRRQVASVLFVASVAVVVFSAISYLAGRALVSKPVAQAPAVSTIPEPVAAPLLEATVIKPGDASVAESAALAGNLAPAKDAPDAPMFANPIPSAVYLQMGAVEKGVAVIMVEGLRKRGFVAFAAPGPNEVSFRVLIGPLAEGDAFRRAKDQVDQIGLNSFVRKYQP
jgi:cell division septation protein DedD